MSESQNNITDILKEATDGILTEEVLEQIAETFSIAVEEKAAINVEKALVEQDSEHATKLETLLETIDKDHTTKLKKVVDAVNNNHAQKLVQIAEKYQDSLTNEAVGFKDELVDNISNYLEVYLEEKIPEHEIAEAVKNKKAQAAITTLRSQLGVDFALAQESIKDAVLDGKQQLNENQELVQQLSSQNEQLVSELVNTRSHLVLEQLTVDLPETKKNYIFKVLGGKSEEFITENFDYTLKLFEKTEEDRLEQFKEQAEKKRAKIDRPVASEQLVNEKVETEAAALDQSGKPASGYMSELSKW